MMQYHFLEWRLFFFFLWYYFYSTNNMIGIKWILNDILFKMYNYFTQFIITFTYYITYYNIWENWTVIIFHRKMANKLLIFQIKINLKLYTKVLRWISERVVAASTSLVKGTFKNYSSTDTNNQVNKYFKNIHEYLTKKSI